MTRTEQSASYFLRNIHISVAQQCSVIFSINQTCIRVLAMFGQVVYIWENGWWSPKNLRTTTPQKGWGPVQYNTLFFLLFSTAKGIKKLNITLPLFGYSFKGNLPQHDYVKWYIFIYLFIFSNGLEIVFQMCISGVSNCLPAGHLWPTLLLPMATDIKNIMRFCPPKHIFLNNYHCCAVASSHLWFWPNT